jgi:hypothetical protein
MPSGHFGRRMSARVTVGEAPDDLDQQVIVSSVGFGGMGATLRLLYAGFM